MKHFLMNKILITAFLLITSKAFGVNYCIPGTSGGYSTYPIALITKAGGGSFWFGQFSPNFSQNKAEIFEEDSKGNLTSLGNFDIEIKDGSLSCSDSTVSVLIKVKVPGDDGSTYVALYKTSETKWVNATMWEGKCYTRSQFWGQYLGVLDKCEYKK